MSATMKDVAARAGVSVATVSKVVNNRRDVGASTVEAVRKAMDELGYEPAPPGQRRGWRGRESRPRATNRIAFLMSGLSETALRAPIYVDMLHGIEARLAECGKTMVLRHVPREASPPFEPFPSRVDGVILFGGEVHADLERELRGMPCVKVMGPVPRYSSWDHVSYDNHAVGRLAADYLLREGHRRCAFIGQHLEHGLFGERYEVFAENVRNAGGEVVVLPVAQDGAFSRPAVEKAVEELMALDSLPTAAFIPADMLTTWCQPLLIERGVLPGRDITLVSCNNERVLLDGLRPRPATVDLHVEQVGRRAVDQLLWRIDNREQPRSVTVLDPSLVTEAELGEQAGGVSFWE